MTKRLRIAERFTLPIDLATETQAILGRRGSGKTHTAVVMAEEFLSAGVQVIVIDPLDVWWGLRVSKDGKRAGIPIYVAGGNHADIPLPAESGKVMADVVVDKGLSVVLSLRHLSKNDQRRFVADFCERLYDRKGEEKHRTALHLFVDEADAFVPQRLVPGSERTFGAVDTLVRRGRSSGIAPTLISQRPQVINKDVLSQTEVLVSHQLTGPQDRKALQTWIEAHDTEDRSDEFMDSLASLPKGTAWFWSPGFLDVFEKVAVRDRHTFDSSSTPKASGGLSAKPKAFARVDLSALTSEIEATIERAKADDPKQLRKALAESHADVQRLEKICEDVADALNAHDRTYKPGALAEAARKAMSAKPGKRVEVPALKESQIVRLEKLVQRADEVSKALSLAVGDVLPAIRKVGQSPTPAAAVRVHGAGMVHRVIEQQAPKVRAAVERAVRQIAVQESNGNGDLGTGAPARILAVLKQFPGANAKRVGALAGVSPRLSTWRVAIARLRQANYIAGDRGGFRLTPAGESAAAHVPAAPTGKEAIEHWRKELGDGAPRRIFDALVDAYPHTLSADDLHGGTGIDPRLSTWRVAVAKLRNLELVEGNRSGMRAAAGLFE